MELETAVLKFTILRDGKLGRVAIPDVHGVALLYLRQGTHQACVGRVQERDPLLLQRHPTASELQRTPRARGGSVPGRPGRAAPGRGSWASIPWQDGLSASFCFRGATGSSAAARALRDFLRDGRRQSELQRGIDLGMEAPPSQPPTRQDCATGEWEGVGVNNNGSQFQY